MTIDVTSLHTRRADNRWDRVAIGDMFERVAAARPDAEAIVADAGAFGDPVFARVTYGAADAFANRFANALLEKGLQRGDRVLMLCENSTEGLLAKVGIAKARGVAVPVNPRQVVSFFDHVASLTEPAFVVADREFLGIARDARLKVDIVIDIGTGESEAPTFTEFCAQASAEPPELTIHGDDIWQIMFTSGTTSLPKGVMQSHIYSYLTALSWIAVHARGLRHESLLRSVAFAPAMFHVADQGYIMPTFFAGGTAIIGRTMKPDRAAAAVAREQATMVCTGNRYLTLQFLSAIEAIGPEAGRSLTSLIHATGVLSHAELERLSALSPSLNIVYLAGQTESVTSHRFAYGAFPDTHNYAVQGHHNLIGMPTPLLASIAIDPETGGDSLSALPDRTIGELVYRSPVMMAGYYRDEDATREAFAGGWFHSGDLGMTEPTGDRVMTGRIKDMIKTGGENVASSRVETVILSHPAVEQAAVVGLPDERWGEIVVAGVVLSPGAAFDESALIAFCRDRLPGYETPKRLFALDALPQGFGGKIEKRRLREILAAKAGDVA